MLQTHHIPAEELNKERTGLGNGIEVVQESLAETKPQMFPFYV